MTIYRLRSDCVQYATFNEINEHYDQLFYNAHWNWTSLKTQYPYVFEIIPNDFGRKNFQFDVSISTGNYCIFSEKAINILTPFINDKGAFFDIQTPSKRKKFQGFYPYKNVLGAESIHFEQSEILYHDNGSYQVLKPVFHSNVCDHLLFAVKNIPLSIFVNDTFKDLVEQHDLKGFDFSETIEIAD